MKEINVKYSTTLVKILIENNIIDKLNMLLDDTKSYFVITETNVAELYLDKIKLPNMDYLILPSGEETKSMEYVSKIISKLLEKQISKSDYLIAFGGGVISDICGFVASIYKRGINYINIPTTLLSQVDACLGGKTGINFNSFKNQIGTIYHPRLIIVDPYLTKTLPNKEYLSGLGEIVKYGLCFDRDLFYQLYGDFYLDDVIYKCLKIKAEITEKDEFEKNIRYALNFGHTIGHAIEALCNYTIPHGICVIYGMLLEIKDQEIKNKLNELLKKFEIEHVNFDLTKIKDFIIQDKKINDSIINLPVVEKIGSVEIKKVKLLEFLETI